VRISGIRRTDDIDLLDDGVGGDEFNFSGLHAGKPAVVKAEVDDDGVDVVGEGEDPPVEIAVLLGEGPGQPEDDFEDPPSSDDDDDIHVPVCLDDPEQDDRDLAAGLFRIAPRDCHVKHEWDDTAGAMQWTNRADGTPLGRSSFMGDSCILVKCCVHDHVRCGRILRCSEVWDHVDEHLEQFFKRGGAYAKRNHIVEQGHHMAMLESIEAALKHVRLARRKAPAVPVVAP